MALEERHLRLTILMSFVAASSQNDAVKKRDNLKAKASFSSLRHTEIRARTERISLFSACGIWFLLFKVKGKKLVEEEDIREEAKRRHEMLMKRRRGILWVGHDGPKGHSLLIPIVVTISFLLFVVTMYVNNCPAHSPGNCTLSSLGRLSFQPLSDNPLFGPSAAALSTMGGISMSTVAKGHQIWRPFSCVWLHAGVIHLILDLLGLLFVGIRLEQEFGCWKVACVYFLSGIGGSLLSSLFIEDRVSVGSSGALFGLMGALLSEIIPNWSKHEGKVPTFMTLGILAILLFIIGLFPHVGNFSHIGGFVFGFFLGYVFFRRRHWDRSTNHPSMNHMEEFQFCKTMIWAIVVIILVIIYLVLMVLAFKGVDANEHCSWCRNFSCVPSSHWKCGGSGSQAVCKYMISGSTLMLTCQANQRSQIYSGIYSMPTIKQLCSELCS